MTTTGVWMLPVALAALLGGGCARSGSERAAVPTPGHSLAAEAGAAPRAPGDPEGGAEGRETAEELHLRERAHASLAAYRAPSCAAAIAHIESLLRRGKGRWQARPAAQPLPDDLVAALSEAQLWAVQSRPLCQAGPDKARFDDLQALMDGMWRYPIGVPKAEFERRLGMLGD